MKKTISLILILALALTLAPAVFGAEVCLSSQKLTVDGAAVSCQAYNIDGSNYYRLRDLAKLLNGTKNEFSVDWDAAKRVVNISVGKTYTADGTELAAGSDQSATAVKSSQTIVIDGKTVTGLSVYNIGGSNFFKLAELKDYVGFSLDYSEATRTVAIRTEAAASAAESYAAVYKALSSQGGTLGGVRRNGSVTGAVAEAPAAAEDAKADSGSGYSGTNVQVEGFDEGDIVKTDGTYIYVLCGGVELVILKADGPNTAVVSRTAVGYSRSEDSEDDKQYSSENKYAQEMFVDKGRVVILSGYYWYHNYTDDTGWHYENKDYTCVDVYDCTDPAAPRLMSELGQDGDTLGSRMCGGKVYVATRYWVWDCSEDEPDTYIPRTYANEKATLLPSGCIIVDPECSSSEYVVLCSYDLETGSLDRAQSLLGGGDELYMNDSGIYILGSRYTDTVTNSYTESVYQVEEHRNSAETEIYRFDIADGGLEPAGSGKVPGYLDSQFSADEYKGYLRLVTTSNVSTYRIYSDDAYGFQNYQWDEDVTTDGLYILDGELNIVGRVEDLAPGERVYSARFDGDIAYFCTYRQTDPLFTADVSDPTAPKILSALKISGFSEYLHSWGDDRLFGFGRETNEETGWNEGLKLVMFNTANKTDVTVENYLVLDSNYSEALYNHKAFFIDREKNIIGFLGEEDYYIFSYTAEGGFKQLSHFKLADGEWNARGLYIGDWAYIIGSAGFQILNMNTWGTPVSLSFGA